MTSMLPTVFRPWRPELTPGEVDCLQPDRGSRCPARCERDAGDDAKAAYGDPPRTPPPNPGFGWITGRRFHRFSCPRQRLVPPTPGASPERTGPWSKATCSASEGWRMA